jgi:hypothetical protein
MANISDIRTTIEEAEKLRAEKRAKLLELLPDPAVADILQLYVQAEIAARNGNHNGVEIAEVIHTKPIIKPGKRTGLKEAIRNLTLPHRFTANDVYDRLTAQGFQFPDEQDVKGSIRDTLLALRTSANPEIRIAVKWKANTPQLYEWIRK